MNDCTASHSKTQLGDTTIVQLHIANAQEFSQLHFTSIKIFSIIFEHSPDLSNLMTIQHASCQRSGEISSSSSYTMPEGGKTHRDKMSVVGYKP